MISRIKTDNELVQEAARKLAIACSGEEFDIACTDMVEALRYGRSVQWWAQFEREVV
jgi:hypothetical protein